MEAVVVHERFQAIDWARRKGVGLLTVGVLALAASFLSEHYGGPQLLYALLFGMALNYLSETPATREGIDFASTTVLRAGVAMLGARITLAQVASTGWRTAALVVFAVASTILFGAWLGRRLQGSTAVGVLAGGAVAICGVSAALALASVLPKDERVQRFTLLSVVGITVLSTLCMVVYPMLVVSLGVDAQTAGIFLGATIHDVAQVVGAGYMVSSQTGDTATLVKLLRVALLLPVVAIVSMCFRLQAVEGRGIMATVPWFLLVFAGLVVIGSADILPAVVVTGLSHASRWCLVAAIAALGTKTSIQKLSQLGWRPVALLVANTLFLAGVVGGGLWMLGISAR